MRATESGRAPARLSEILGDIPTRAGRETARPRDDARRSVPAQVALAGAALGCKVLGERWAWSAKAARLGVAYALPWIALSFVPLDRWFPAMADGRAGTTTSFSLRAAGSGAAPGHLGGNFESGPTSGYCTAQADVTAHTELLTATALGVERGGVKRWGGVLGATALVSASAGILEEAAFRGVLQRAAAAGLRAVFTLGRPATVLARGPRRDFVRGRPVDAALPRPR